MFVGGTKVKLEGEQRRRDFGNRETRKTSVLMNEPKEDP